MKDNLCEWLALASSYKMVFLPQKLAVQNTLGRRSKNNCWGRGFFPVPAMCLHQNTAVRFAIQMAVLSVLGFYEFHPKKNLNKIIQ